MEAAPDAMVIVNQSGHIVLVNSQTENLFGFSREELLDAVWGPDIHVEPRTVDVHIRRLRKSINGKDDLDIVRTVRAAGYALDTEPV